MRRYRKGFLMLVSMALIATSCVVFLACDLGADPLTVLLGGLSRSLCVSYGTASSLYNLLMTAAAFLLARRHVGPGSIAYSLGIGPCISLAETVLSRIDWRALPLAARGGLVLAAQAVMTLGMALLITAGLGANSLDALLLRLRERLGVRFQWLRTGADAALLAAGMLLGGTIGAGTVLCAVTTGLLMAFHLRRLQSATTGEETEVCG